MSAEPNHKAPYSSDLRWRIVWQKFGMELTYRRIAQNLSVSVGTVHNVLKLFEQTAEVSAKIPERDGTRKIDDSGELLIVGLLMENPSLYLGEICQEVQGTLGIQVSPSTVCRIIHRNGFTRKKIQQVATQRSTEFRGRFIAEVQHYHQDQFVWVDESGCDRRDQIRKFGYALRGERPVYHRFLHRGQRVSIIAALSTDGMVTYELKKGTVNGEDFLDFVHGSLIPNMLPFDGENPRSIVVMDNCSIHHTQPVLDAFDQAGIVVLFQPPYSPDMNPVKNVFSYIKYYLKQHDDILQFLPDICPVLKEGLDSITSNIAQQWITYCGY